MESTASLHMFKVGMREERGVPKEEFIHHTVWPGLCLREVSPRRKGLNYPQVARENTSARGDSLECWCQKKHSASIEVMASGGLHYLTM